MRWMHKLLAITVLTAVFAAVGAAQDDVLEDTDMGVGGETKLGGVMETEYMYELNEVTRIQAVETALVIDESGSMGNNGMQKARDAAEHYVDQMSIAAGDRAGVASYNDQLQTDTGLTADQDYLKSEIDDLSQGGGTCIDCGIDGALDWSYEDDDEAVRGMIVMTDGIDNDGGDPVEAADEAWETGFTVHGIIYGDDADTDTMEGMTQSDCEQHPRENNDGDTCWYQAHGDDLEDIYEDINEDLVQEASSVRVHLVLPDHAVPKDSYLEKHEDYSDTHTRYVLAGSSEEGTHTGSFEWYVGESGQDVEIMSGESYLEYRVDGEDHTADLGGDYRTADIGYSDFVITDHAMTQDWDGIDISVTVENQGTLEAPATNIGFFHEYEEPDSAEVWYSGNDIPSLAPGESYTFTRDDVDSDDYPYVFENSTADIHARVDVGIDATFGEDGNILEPDETNNEVSLGRVDLDPPTTTVPNAKSDWDTTWRNTPQDVELDCNDVHPGKTIGCDVINWRVESDYDDDTRSGQSGSETTVIAGQTFDGVLDLYYRGVDGAANREGWNVQTLLVDTITPETRITAPDPDDPDLWFGEGSFQVSFTEPFPGPSGYDTGSCRYQVIDDGAAHSVTSRNCNGTATVSVGNPDCTTTGEDTCTVESYVDDNAGNTGQDTASYNIDLEPPEIDCDDCTVPDPVTLDEAVAFVPTVTDPHSGVDTVTICRDASCSDPYCSYDADATDRCTHTAEYPYEFKDFCIRAEDHVGNAQTRCAPDYNFEVLAGADDPCQADDECIFGNCVDNVCQPTQLSPPQIFLY